MIDYLTVVYKNYSLLDLQVKNFKNRLNKKEYRLIVVDNTPDEFKKPYEFDREVIDKFILKESVPTFDGISHGGALDFGLQYCSSDVISIIDSDFFILNNNIHNYVYDKLETGFKAVGCEYNDGRDTANWVNKNPASFENIPCCFGAYYTAEVAKAASWTISPEELSSNMATGFVEVGFKIRQFILNNKIKTLNWKTNSGRPCFFKNEYNKMMGVHYVAGSHSRNSNESLNEIKNIIEKTYE